MSKGAAILAVGYGLADATPALTSLVAQIGETLLAIGWRVRRLSPLAGERDGADRASWKRCVSEVCDADADVIVLALAGRIVMHADEPCLVTGTDVGRFPEDETLPLEWIRERLRNCRADRVVVVGSFDGPSDNAWLDALATGRARHVVAVERSNGRVLPALLDGLRGSAIDPKTGTITLRSLGDHLAHNAPKARLQVSDESETLASSPPLAGPWDARLTSRPSRTITVDEALVGTVLPGRFEIVKELARGSFGNVFLARQLSVDRDVAVKVLHGALAPGSEAGRLFVQEIQSVGRLDHPNVVKIQADITAGGSLFYAMEFLAGRDLQQIIETDKKIERPRAIALVRQLASALGAAHEVGLVHADVKPANAVVVEIKTGERLVLLDFGLARLRAAGELVESAGGTPAYMAPEQLRDARVDPRSDVFSAALVLVTLLTGWRRRAADELVPPLDTIDDANLRTVLAKALALAPAERYANGGELAVALGEATRPAVPTAPPFRHLASFTEADRDRLYGRDREITTLVEHVLFRRAVVYTAPTGTGKTSLLRAGLVPRLDALGVACVYVACHGREPPDLARAIWTEGATALAAATARIASEHKRLVIVVDQVEAALASREFVAELCALQGSELELGLVLSVREDVLASLLTQLDAQTNVLRLGPLAPEGAREAIVGPLIERRVTIEEPLLAALLADLERAASLIAAEMRWPAEHAVYPPHLQLACSALFDQLEPGEDVLALRHYEKLGGLDEIVRDYLDRVLETELPSELVATARRVLLALVDSDRSRAVRTDAELAEQLPANAPLADVLEALRSRGIVVPLRSAGGQPAWELVHDSLVPRVLAWSDRQDLARQRALEIVRHHLRGSQTSEQPSLLSANELREVSPHAAAIAELDQEWTRRGLSTWTPAGIVEQSRHARRMRIAGMSLAVVTVLGAASFLGLRWFSERDQRRRAELLSKGDIGSFTLEIHAFDLDPKTRTSIPAEVPATLDWKLLEPESDDDTTPSKISLHIEREELAPGVLMRRWHIEARGGKAILSVTGRGPCAPSIVPIARLPGYASRDLPPRFVIQIPTCATSANNTVVIPAGPYISGGLGEPPIEIGGDLDSVDVPAERTIDLPEFAIDRTEVSNAEYRMITSPSNETTVVAPLYPHSKSILLGSGDDYPVAEINWSQARAYCRFLGKDLPSDSEWEKARRGGLVIGDQRNPMPRRNAPWGSIDTTPANLKDSRLGDEHAVPVDANPGDVSPYGVLDLAGNVQEWTRTQLSGTFYAARGCGWSMCTSATMTQVLAIPNGRDNRFTSYEMGFRCVLEGRPSND